MEQKIKILLAEDDINLGTLLREYLVAKDYETDLFENGELAYKAFMNNHYDACVLDIMMPIKDGFTLAKDIRTVNSEIPILFLTAKNMKEDVFEGFEIGADDYITKPFSMHELLLRLEAVLRRTKKFGATSQQQIFTIGKYHFDAQKQILKIEDKEEKLTTKESELLRLLALHMNDILERNYALKTIWIEDNYFNARSMDVYITKLRKHLKEDSNVQILNVHGKGYKLISE